MLEGNMGLHSISIWMALLTGFGLAALYDCFRVARTTFSGRGGTSGVLDFFYLLFCGLVTYLLALAVDFGRVRFFLLACEVIGACVYFMTVGVVTDRAARLLHRAFVWLRRQLRRFLWRPAAACLRRAGRAFAAAGRQGKSFLEKRAKKRKNLLKCFQGILYNQNVDVYQKQAAAQAAEAARGEPSNEGHRRNKKKT